MVYEGEADIFTLVRLCYQLLELRIDVEAYDLPGIADYYARV